MAGRNRATNASPRPSFRPYSRKSRLIDRSGSAAARLQHAAGDTTAIGERAMIEPLEKRQMLFSLTVTPDNIDPATGLGRVVGIFRYSLPILVTPTTIPAATPPQTVVENFNDEAPGALGSGGLFLESNVRLRHNVNPADISIQPPGQAGNDRWMRIALNSNNDFFSFTFSAPDTQAGQPVRIQQVQRVTFQTFNDTVVTDTRGFDLARTKVQLIQNNVIIDELQGARLQAAFASAVPNANLGIGTFTFNAPQNNPGFDTIKIISTAADSSGEPAFRLDNLSWTLPPTQFSQLIASQARFGARVELTGPVGASINVRDLYDREMQLNFQIGQVDPDGNGVPNGNDGIGSIRLTGTDSRSSFTIWGGEWTEGTTPDPTAEAFDGLANYKTVDNVLGQFDAFESAGFGYIAVVQGTQFQVRGLPPGAGSVVIGSPYVRNNTNQGTYNPGGLIPGGGAGVTTGFVLPNQGIFVDGGKSIGSVQVHGVLHGSSRFSGAVDRLNIGYLVGSVTVDGDLGSMVLSSDAGQWVLDPGVNVANVTNRVFKTAGQVVVGRTVGDISIAGRSLLDITVLGDTNSPTLRPTHDFHTYYEHEFVLGIDTTTPAYNTILGGINFVYGARDATQLQRPDEQPMFFGDTFLRNDNIMNAEFVSSVSTGVRIVGELSGRDPFNGEDTDDVYGFAVDGTQEVVIEGTGGIGNIRIVDQNGRTVAAPGRRFGRAGTTFSDQFRFKPDSAGVYYMVITDPNGADGANGFTSYTVSMTGLASVNFGALRYGGGAGTNALALSVNLLSGSMGSLRVGTGIADNAGVDSSPAVVFNTIPGQSLDDAMSWQGGAFSIPGTVYNITTGSDIGAGTGTATGTINITIGGNLGSLFTGLSPLVGQAATEGDLNFLQLNVGGSIGIFRVSGGIGMDQDNTGNPRAVIGRDGTVIQTGTAGGRGDIAEFRVGFHVAGESVSIRTSPGSIIQSLLVSQDVYGDIANPASGIYTAFGGGPRGIILNTGLGSDVRFFDVPRIDFTNSVNLVRPLNTDTFEEFVDDGGARVRITVSGGTRPPGQAGTVRFIPVDGSQGVAIAQITVDLAGGRTLTIDAIDATGAVIQPGLPPAEQRGGTVGIGRIVVTNADAQSAINLTGPVQLDVYRIEQTAGTGFGSISNTTPNGDIVAIDVQALATLDITRGDLGKTQVVPWGPSRIGPEMGLAADLVTEARGALGIQTAGIVDTRFGGDDHIYRPLNDDDFNPTNAYADDVGWSLDSTLNGIVIRNGSVTSVTVAGAVGDVILQGGAGTTLTTLTVNSDRTTRQGAFDGIIGTIYGFNIGNVDIGDGLAEPENSPLLTTGIAAANNIGAITSGRTSGAVIRGVISASNITAALTVNDLVAGIGSVQINNGVIQGAFFGAENLDAFWNSIIYGEVNIRSGDIGSIQAVNTNFFRSDVEGRDMLAMTLTGGYFDASTISMNGRIFGITAKGFRNSTLLGTSQEYHENTIGAGGDLDQMTAVDDIVDLTIEVNHSVPGTIRAANITRATIGVDAVLSNLAATNIRSSSIVVGELPTLTTVKDIENSTIAVSGLITTLTAGDRIVNSDISVTGPDGRIRTITASRLISGKIAASGQIDTVSVTAGDLVADIRTTTSNGNIGLLSASRDLAITTDVSGTVSRLQAGRNIGSQTHPGVILIRRDLTSATAATGQLYSDIRVGGNITGSVTVNQVLSKPERNLLGSGSIIAFGRIASVIINGDMNGDIISYTGGLASVVINNGSLMPGHTVAAYDGDITSFTINNGDLLGNVHADYNLTSVRVVGAADGVFGNIGVNPAKSQFAGYDGLRNRLPVGVAPTSAAQGARIYAGFNIVNVTVTGGSVFESVFQAGRTIQSISIAGDVKNDHLTSGIGSAFVAGDTIDGVVITGSVSNSAFLAGGVDLGKDNRPGGTLVNADRTKSGVLNNVTINGNLSNSIISAGTNAGADGIYNNTDDRLVLGLSSVNTLTVRGTVTNSSIYADALGGVGSDTRFTRVTNITSANSDLDNGTGTPGTAFTGTQTFNLNGGGTVTLAFGGAGQAFFNATTNKVTLRNTTSASSLVVSSSLATLTGFDIVTNNNASLGTLTVSPALAGDSDVVIDGGVTTLNFNTVNGTGDIKAGGDVNAMNFGNLAGGFVEVRNLNALTVTGDYGNSNPLVFNEVRIQALSAGTLAFRGEVRGAVSVDRNATSVTSVRTPDRSAFRFGNNLASFTAPGIKGTVLSVGDTLGSVTLAGDMFDSAIIAGNDLGTDSAFGGVGTAADRVTTGFIGPVTVNGTFKESDIVAGYNRGADGFFGSSDDTVASGLSTIGAIVITGNDVGSPRFSEQYRIASSGTIASLSIGGAAFNGTRGNFASEQALGVLAPIAIGLQDVVVTQDARVYTANLIFNQPIDSSTLSKALSVSEVRGSSNITIRLIEGADYTVSYDAATNTAKVRFSQTVTSANLPLVPGVPGPGVYRFQLEQDILRGKALGNQTDGNGDGYSQPGDKISVDAIVGDAGDKLFNEVNPVVGTIGTPIRVDFYAPANLDWVLDNNFTSDGLPDVNKTITIRGTIGDHPDNDTNQFRFAGDTDLYQITLQAGQIVRLGRMQGAALLAQLFILDPTGTAIPVQPVGQTNIAQTAVSLPTPTRDLFALTTERAFLIKTTGVYTIGVGNAGTFATPNAVPNIDPVAQAVGDYNFTLQVFDDGDSGFTAPTDSGDGGLIVDAPTPIAFAGPNGVFDNGGDDATEIRLNGYTFTLNRGADGLPNTSDDVVTGSNGITTSSRDGNGRLVSTISAAIGLAGHAGVPIDVASDVDIFHLNSRQPIIAGTKLRVTVKLTEAGADLGSNTVVAQPLSDSNPPIDRRGAVQFGVFETTGSTTIEDGTAIFSPTDFLPYGGTPSRVIADNGSTKYGYDANGDFFVEFVAPPSSVAGTTSGSFAVYMQGLFNTDYQLEVVTNGTATQAAAQRQNFLLETRGGTINWLEAGGLTTNVGAFSGRTLGFNGTIANGQLADDYILSNLVTSLNAIFQGALGGSQPGQRGYDVRFSTNPADFEFQPFSTIYLTSTSDPLSTLFNSFFFGIPLFNTRFGFFGTQPFGFSQHSDVMNANLQDEAVVFAPSFGLLGLSPAQADADRFVQSLTSAVGRRAGELMGLRVTSENDFGGAAVSFDFMAADAVTTQPGPGRSYVLSNANRILSTGFDSVDRTDFFLGRQNSRSLLDRIIARN